MGIRHSHAGGNPERKKDRDVRQRKAERDLSPFLPLLDVCRSLYED
jgi:hypothetical protein